MELQCGNFKKWAKINKGLFSGEWQVVVEEGSWRVAEGGEWAGWAAGGWAAGPWREPRCGVCLWSRELEPPAPQRSADSAEAAGALP